MTRVYNRRPDFIARSIMSAAAFVKEATLCEEHARYAGFLQSLDPRAKAITFLALLVTVAFLEQAALIGLVYCACLVLAWASKISPGYFLIRTWVFIPLFTLGIVIPAMFSFVTPGAALAAFDIWGVRFVITRPGFDGAVLLVARVAASVSLAVLLSLTTRHAELLKVLRIFGVPQVFVLTVTMCYRYLYLFATLVENIFTAIRSRVGVMPQRRAGRRVVAWNIANTWSRTTKISEEVYLAMLSRGYTGEPRLLAGFQLRLRDLVWALAVFVWCAGLLYLERR
ncbi:MAG: cobalt ECF transporter T component CbiQ [Candidatus Omnitrophica bacterium]|nr:cobalt ECF transporter T component CbiQ [Candidatus Omnitrophota bacterium]